MDLGTQIKKLRLSANLSQEELADEIYVSRQTISNWENDKNYPDIKSLLLLTELFDVSLDTLVKGDIEIMKQEISKEDQKKWKKHVYIFIVLMSLTVLSSGPLFFWLDEQGMVIWGLLALVTICYAYKVEKLQKKNNIQTYREVVTFMEGKTLSEQELTIELAKRPYQTIVYMGGATLLMVAITVAIGMFLLWTGFGN